MSMIITNAGRNAIAQALANNTTITVAHIAFGTANRHPTGGETALTTEVIRKAVLNYGVTEDGKTYFDARLEAADGPFVIYEIGLFSSTGTLLFIGRIEGFNKLVMVDQPITLDMRAYVLASQFENIVVKIDTSFAFVSAARKVTGGKVIKGGGDLSADRDFDLDFSDLDELSAASIHLTDDTMVIWDASAGDFKSLNMDAVSEKVLSSARFASALVSGGRWILKSAAYTAKAGERIRANVSGGSWQLNLPAVAVAGDTVIAAVSGGVKAGPMLTIAGNGNNIHGDPSMLVNVFAGSASVELALIFDGSEWKVSV
tara:strand:- start:326 stop:1270 length:945 start_codon:yes stop_codon:yes gene_type:complete